MPELPLLAPVAFLVDLPEKGLTRGEMGTVVEYLGPETEPGVLVEFADQLVVLHRRFRAA